MDKNFMSLIISELLNQESHQISRPVLLKRMWAHYKDARELDEIMMRFNVSGMIVTTQVGNQTVYTMPHAQVIELRRLLTKKNEPTTDDRDPYVKMCDEKIEFWQSNRAFHIRVEDMVMERLTHNSSNKTEEEIRNEVMDELEVK